MESVTCCFLIGLEVLAKVSKQCGVGVELEQEPGLSVLPPQAQRLLQPGDVLGERPGQRDTEPLYVWGKALCPLVGVFVRDSEN